jgi:hypothetical protein
VFSSRSASTWPTPMQGSSVFAVATPFGGKTEPIFRHREASAGEEEEEDLESSYLPSGHAEPSLSFTATATSRARSGSQLSPA